MLRSDSRHARALIARRRRTAPLGRSQVACGAHHSVALSRDGVAFAWGWGKFGQLGDGQLGVGHARATPARVRISAADGGEAGPGGASALDAIASGEYHVLALGARGDVFAWGCNASGQLGDGSAIDRAVPTVVRGALAGARALAVAGGGGTSAAVTADGRAWAWGHVLSLIHI